MPGDVGNSQRSQTATPSTLDGFGEHIATERLTRAHQLVERMNHKDALYAHLGRMALVNNPPETDLRRHLPRSLPERWIGKRILHAALKKYTADEYAKRDRRIFTDESEPEAYGPEGIVPDFYIRERLAAAVFNDQPVMPVLPTWEARRNAATIGASELRGMTKAEKRREKRKVAAEARRGHITPQEARTKKLKIDATRVKLGHTSYQGHHKLQRKANKAFRNVTEQPFLSRWRDMRRKRAVARIRKINQRYPGLESR